MNSRILYAVMILGGFFVLTTLYDNFGIKNKPVKVLLVKNKALEYYDKKDLQKLSDIVKNGASASLETLSSLPYIKSANLSRSLSGVNQIKLSLQEPVFALSSGESYKLVNSNGEIFSEVPQYKIPDLPILSGKNFLIKKNRLAAANVLNKMPDAGVISKNTLSEVLFKDDMSFVFSGVEGEVYLGEKNIVKKVTRLVKVVKYLRFHGMATQLIDARFDHKITVSLKES